MSTPGTLKPSSRLAIDSSTITSSATMKIAPSAAQPSYSASSARRIVAAPRSELAVGVDDGLAVGAGLVEPLLQHHVADLLQVGGKLRRRRDDVHAVLLQ